MGMGGMGMGGGGMGGGMGGMGMSSLGMGMHQLGGMQGMMGGGGGMQQQQQQGGGGGGGGGAGGAADSVILEEEFDPNYEPTEDEILEYAQFLQMDLKEDADLFWIAREGLKAPLPEPWKPCKTENNEVYYFNFENGSQK